MLAGVSKVLLSWSTGKDSAWALHLLRRRGEVEVVGFLMTLNEAADRVAMHAVRRELVEAQAAAVGLPLYPVMQPHPGTNEVHEDRMMAAISEATGRGVTHLAFGDLLLEEVRATGVGPWRARTSSRSSRSGSRCMRRPPWLGGGCAPA